MESSNQLKRSLGLATVVALGLNGVIGSGVFFMPGLGAAMMGPSVLVALLLGGFLCFLMLRDLRKNYNLLLPLCFLKGCSIVGFAVAWLAEGHPSFLIGVSSTAPPFSA